MSVTAQPRTAIATVCLSGTLEDKLVAAAAAGFDGVEIFEPDLVASPSSPAQVRDRCRELGLSIDLYQPFRDFDSVDPAALTANLRRAELKFDIMQELGTDLVLVCSSVSPDAVDDDRVIADQLCALAERAAERGLRVSYEALAWGRHVNTYERSWEIVKAADHPALGLCLDSFHILSRGSDPAGIRTFRARSCSSSSSPTRRDAHGRPAVEPPLPPVPGPGCLRPAGVPRACAGRRLLRPALAGDLQRRLPAVSPARAAVDALRSLRVLYEATNARLTGDLHVDLPELPPAPALGGHAFVELAGDERPGANCSRP